MMAAMMAFAPMSHLHGEVENRDAPNQSFELRTFLLSGWIGDYVR